jgi:peptidoglycan/xylan/chitin deacetylase (PgdA/CDA1 family)
VPLVNHDGLQCPDCTLEAAMVDSLNTPFYAVTERIGADRVRDMAVALGIPATYEGRKSMVDAKGDPQPGRTRSDIAIGRYPVTPGDLATVYATFAAGGERHDRYFVESAVAADGTILRKAAPRGWPVLDQDVASDVSTVLSSAVRGDDVAPGRPAAGKTGTQQWGNTKDNQDAWMVWLGKEKPGPIRDSAGKPIEGDTVPARLWRDFVNATLKGKPKAPLLRPAMVGRTDVGDAGQTAASRKPAPPTLETPVIHTAGQGRRLALTFDDGPSEYTPDILDLLRKQHVKAVFCVVGDNVDRHPDLVRRIVDEGHGLCNHSSHHDDLGVLDPAKAKADIEATDAALARAVPGETVTWFRAPFGSWGAAAKAGVGLGHTPLGWVVDPDDWKMPGAGVIAERIREQLTPRSVVLMHDGGGEREQTVEALRALIPALRHDGWIFDLPERTVRTHPLPSPGPSTSAAAPPPSEEPRKPEAPQASPEVPAPVDQVVESLPPS